MMRAHFLSIGFLAAVMLAACTSAPEPTTGATTPSDSVAPSPTTAHSPIAVVSPTPPASPTPTPTSSPVVPNAQEKFLLAGIRDDAAVDCAPRRTDLPTRAIAGVECSPRTGSIERVGFYLFDTDKAMLATYFERLAAEGIQRNEGSCFDGEGEQGYIPGENDAEILDREGCFINEFEIANYRATVPGEHVYIGILGRNANSRDVQDFAWKFNQDTPGTPTIWSAANL
jgi:hypothetical protein